MVMSMYVCVCSVYAIGDCIHGDVYVCVCVVCML